MITHLVSCIVPVYNGERYLAQALASILAQTYVPIEIIVVDDGSTDGTPDVVRQFGDAVRYVRQDNAGPATARNHGLGLTRGEFVAFLDADDLWTPDKLERQVGALNARPDLDFVVCHAQNFWEDELADEARQYEEHSRGQPIAAYVTQALVARKTAFGQVGPFNASLGHGDSMDWFLRAREKGVSGELLDDVMVLRRMHPDNVSRTQASRSLDEFFGILKGALDRKRAAGTSPAAGAA
jgi:glycosyltransferase involved in cell wall biosynthesis